MSEVIQNQATKEHIQDQCSEMADDHGLMGPFLF
jgi:hypothetical protein